MTLLLILVAWKNNLMGWIVKYCSAFPALAEGRNTDYVCVTAQLMSPHPRIILGRQCEYGNFSAQGCNLFRSTANGHTYIYTVRDIEMSNPVKSFGLGCSPQASLFSTLLLYQLQGLKNTANSPWPALLPGLP